MRKLGVLAAASTMFLAMPAQAAVTTAEFRIAGSVPVSVFTDYGQDQSIYPPECAGQFLCTTQTNETFSVDWAGVWASSLDGILYTFNDERFGLGSAIAGTFRYIGNGAYEGISLSYGGSTNLGNYPLISWSGSTDTFSVYQTFPTAVPEPITWLLMIFGFGGVGAILRRKQPVVPSRMAA